MEESLHAQLSLANQANEVLRRDLKEKNERIEELENDNKKLREDVDLLTSRVEDMQQETFKYQEKVIELIES
ncbi:sulfite reductase [NADPH] flavoprotein alpha-component [Acrasis kona]|uniref:Sulfite reductase [NADPH] flavoprotein alpha-component n=1 Tax=Acrasis kona TaxID=1008807 RepID=A0AAW2Z2K2_9EUKA